MSDKAELESLLVDYVQWAEELLLNGKVEWSEVRQLILDAHKYLDIQEKSHE